MKELKAVLRLRRDNDYNYEKIKDSFIPANGEICLVDTAKEGLRIICGNGVDKFGDLKFIDGTLIKGYYKNNNFYEDENFEKIVQGNNLKIYLNIPDNTLYFYDEDGYNVINTQPSATTEMAGIMKLYETPGKNIDGTMTQKAITEEINSKISTSVEEGNELLIFS